MAKAVISARNASFQRGRTNARTSLFLRATRVSRSGIFRHDASRTAIQAMLRVLLELNVPPVRAVKTVVSALRVAAQQLRAYERHRIRVHRHQALETFQEALSQLLCALESLSPTDRGQIN